MFSSEALANSAECSRFRCEAGPEAYLSGDVEVVAGLDCDVVEYELALGEMGGVRPTSSTRPMAIGRASGGGRKGRVECRSGLPVCRGGCRLKNAHDDHTHSCY